MSKPPSSTKPPRVKPPKPGTVRPFGGGLPPVPPKPIDPDP